ncbi:transcription factor TGA2.3 [Syzygium oleosum]|uniref:transcription factor TGA2.3 n=1 Tax=Syzygium oleosum TaxID=219896 RepID=UPI0011D24372|nr:transcription factor TGA2.3 [Syzygium oleosum]
MQSFKAAPTNTDIYCQASFFLRGDDVMSRNQTRFADFGELQQSVAAFHHEDTVDLSPSSAFSLKPNNSIAFVANNLSYGGLNTCMSSSGVVTVSSGGGGGGGGGGCVEMGEIYEKGGGNGGSLGNVQGIENWADSGMAAPDNSQQTDTSTDVDTDDKRHLYRVQRGALVAVDSADQPKMRMSDVKTLRRLAQNREAARKSRLRKKAYVLQLENSRLRLMQLEQELQRARQQGMLVASGIPGDLSHNMAATGNGAMAFDTDYARWLDEHQRLINDLRSGVNSQLNDNELQILVDAVMVHYDEIFRLKNIGAKADVFHILSGMWKTPTERCFMWLGGFRSSELLKILGNHLEPLTEQQLMGICNLQQSSQQAEDALSQGMEALQQSLVETLSSTTLSPTASGNVAEYMGQMAIAMGKLATLENFVHQADLLRQQTLQQMHRILTTRQAARALLVINDYISRLRALSSLWLARPRTENICSAKLF